MGPRGRSANLLGPHCREPAANLRGGPHCREPAANLRGPHCREPAATLRGGPHCREPDAALRRGPHCREPDATLLGGPHCRDPAATLLGGPHCREPAARLPAVCQPAESLQRSATGKAKNPPAKQTSMHSLRYQPMINTQASAMATYTRLLEGGLFHHLQPPIRLPEACAIVKFRQVVS